MTTAAARTAALPAVLTVAAAVLALLGTARRAAMSVAREISAILGMPAPSPAHPSARLLRFALDQLVRRNLRGVWIRGELPVGAAVWATNHHSWWDHFVAAAALRSAGRNDVGVLMEPGNIGRRELYRSVGAVGTDRLRSAVQMLGSGMVLVVFPEAHLRPVGALGPTRAGATWLAARAGVPVVVVATRVLLRGQQAAEAYLDVLTPVAGGDVDEMLRGALAVLDAELAVADPRSPLPGFVQVVPGVRSWQERISGWLGT